MSLVLLPTHFAQRSQAWCDDRAPTDSGKPLLIAHRGGVVDRERIENNLPAIEEAVRRGYYMLEVDIRESKDGHLVVHHDEDFRRFYSDPRRLADLTWEQIKQLRSRPGDLRPIDFAEFARACKGKIQLMLDTKGPEHDEAFFNEMLRILRDNALLEGAFVIGTAQSRQILRGRAKVGVNREELAAAIANGEDVDRLYFLFEHGVDLDAATVHLADKHGVVVVPSVNIFHYPQDKHAQLAEADIRRLRKLGVKYFQIDSVYEDYCKGSSASEVSRFSAAEAVQAVAVDDGHFYAIANNRIGKYVKNTGRLVRNWQASAELPLKHLNSGVVIDGRLYCAHSNYPQYPESSSVEIWTTDTLEHVSSHSFGIYEGSLTWVDWRDNSWWAVFAHYSMPRNLNPRAKNNRWTTLVRFDQQWRRTAGWTFPQEVLDRFAAYSCSGGTWGPDGTLYCSGHDLGELYRLKLPKSGSTLQLIETFRVPITGQGFAWDRQNPGIIYGIDRPKREVVAVRLFSNGDSR